MKMIRGPFVFGIFAMAVSQVMAQTPDAGALQRQIEKQLPQEMPAAPFRLKPPAAVEAPKPAESQATFELKGFKFTGNTLVSVEELQAELKSWTLRQITFAQLEEITAQVMNYYRQKGMIAQAIVPPQSIVNGILEIRVIEAKLSDVIVNPGSTESTRFNAEYAQGFVLAQNPIGSLVSPEAIERAVTLINDLGGVRAAGSLEAGKELGETNFNLALEDLPIYSGVVQASNQGSRSTGILQATASLGLNNLTGYGDVASVFGVKNEGSNYAQASYTLPVGYRGFKVGVNASALNYRNVGEFAASGSHGSSDVRGVNISYPLLSDTNHRVRFNLNFDHKQYQNLAIAGIVSEYQIKNITSGLSGFFGSQLFGLPASDSWSINYVSGDLTIDDLKQAIQDSNSTNTNGSFNKVTFSYNRLQAIIADTTALNFSINGQWASKNLNSGEQFYLGGPSGVRAYPVSQAGGSQGVVTSLELRQSIIPGLQASAFIDSGWVQQYKTLYTGWQGNSEAGNSYRLSGVGLGLKWIQARYQVSASVATPLGNNPLKNSSGQTVNADGRNLDAQGWVSASYFF
jgi:hemolysin activation/secretion protein